jgi:hypothetical protein
MSRHSDPLHRSTGARSGGPTPWRGSTSNREVRCAKRTIKRRTGVVGIVPNDAAIIRLVGALLLEQREEWTLEGRRVFSLLSMAKWPAATIQARIKSQLLSLQLPDDRSQNRSWPSGFTPLQGTLPWTQEPLPRPVQRGSHPGLAKCGRL